MASTERTDAELVARHVDPAGRLTSMPAKPARRQLVLQHIAEQVPAGVELDEPSLNALLRPIDADVAQLRRYLIDAGLLERPAPGRYFRRSLPAAQP